MIAVRLGGGLGNQMFQYALGRRLASDRGSELVLDVSAYEGAVAADMHTRLFGLHRFNIQARIASPGEAAELKRRNRAFFRRLWNKFERSILGRTHVGFEPGVLKAKDGAYLEGFWQSEKYFLPVREALLEDFTLRNPWTPGAAAIAERIGKTKNTVSLHVRRGDYVESKDAVAHYGQCSQAYYSKALDAIAKARGLSDGIAVFAFSDDIQWVKDNLKIPFPVEYVAESAAPDYERMMLMSLCRDHILANSTFGWWSAWLDPKPDKIVIAPDPWTKDISTDDILPPDWIRVPRD